MYLAHNLGVFEAAARELHRDCSFARLAFFLLLLQGQQQFGYVGMQILGRLHGQDHAGLSFAFAGSY